MYVSLDESVWKNWNFCRFHPIFKIIDDDPKPMTRIPKYINSVYLVLSKSGLVFAFNWKDSQSSENDSSYFWIWKYPLFNESFKIGFYIKLNLAKIQNIFGSVNISIFLTFAFISPVEKWILATTRPIPDTSEHYKLRFYKIKLF